ncbi:hypothetical protein HZC20_00190 [Candidatus Peregrinibacteria bacterium]|nr:hypothetical protein [Candidatus Peregrinibacteria bacterium]
MPNLSYLILSNRQKNQVKAYAILLTVLFAIVFFYSFQKWQVYSASREIVKTNKALVSALSTSSSAEKSVYELNKSEFGDLKKEIEERLKEVFPLGDDYTNLTRKLDIFEGNLSKKNDPFEISSIEYQAPVKTSNYSMLPLTMNIRSSKENFKKFLHSVENSGSLKDRVRLMDISSIRLNFEEKSDQKDKTAPEIITFTVQINAYFQ